MDERGPDELILKWGTLKGWKLSTPEQMQLLRDYAKVGMTVTAMDQQDTTEQKELLCKLIESVDGPIFNDWDGRFMTKEQAKEYIMEYGLENSK